MKKPQGKPKPPPENPLLEQRRREKSLEQWGQYVDEMVGSAIELRKQHIDELCNQPFDTKAHSNKIEQGTHVAYAKHFLKSIGCTATDPMWRARGMVVCLTELSKEIILVSVAWFDGQELPERVNLKNLARVGPNLAFTGD